MQTSRKVIMFGMLFFFMLVVGGGFSINTHAQETTHEITITASPCLEGYDEAFRVRLAHWPIVGRNRIEGQVQNGLGGSVWAPRLVERLMFKHWWDNDNEEIFSTDRHIHIEEITRDYNLTAVYHELESYSVSIDSNIGLEDYGKSFWGQLAHSPMRTIYPVEGVITEGNSAKLLAPLRVFNYHFEHWWDNDAEEVYSTDRLLGVEEMQRSYNLTAIYQSIKEYHILIDSNIDLGKYGYYFNVILENYPRTERVMVDVVGYEGLTGSVTAPQIVNGKHFQHWICIITGDIISTEVRHSVDYLDDTTHLRAIYE